MRFTPKILSAISLMLLTSFFTSVSLASVEDVKKQAVEHVKKNHGYGLGYGVINFTPNPLLANGLTVDTATSESLQNTEPVKTKKYTVARGHENDHKSSMSIYDKMTNKLICTVNVSFSSKLKLFAGKPEISKLKASIDQLSSTGYICSIKEKSETTQDGKEAAVVVVLVRSNIQMPRESQPK